MLKLIDLRCIVRLLVELCEQASDWVHEFGIADLSNKNLRSTLSQQDFFVLQKRRWWGGGWGGGGGGARPDNLVPALKEALFLLLSTLLCSAKIALKNRSSFNHCSNFEC